MKAVVFDRFGEPGEVLQTRDLPMPEPGRGQVRVRMLAAPINPSDMLMVRGRYTKVPTLPAQVGFEGVGVIDKTGPGLMKFLRGLKPGRRVAVPSSDAGTWAEYAIVPARQAIPVADGIPDEQAAGFFVNPATVVAMVNHVLRVPPGGWLMQSAAGSALGRMIIRLGKVEGFRTINLVRRKEQGEELRKLGADAVICTSEESIEERVKALTNGKGAPHAIDCVGGATGSGMVKALAEDGHMLVYGTLSDEPIAVEPRVLIGMAARVEGFWLGHWAKKQGPLKLLKLFRQINRLMKEGVLTAEIGATFSLDEVQAAVKQADQTARQGKVLLRISK